MDFALAEQEIDALRMIIQGHSENAELKKKVEEQSKLIKFLQGELCQKREFELTSESAQRLENLEIEDAWIQRALAEMTEEELDLYESLEETLVAMRELAMSRVCG